MGLHKAVLKLKIKEFTAYRSNVLMNFCFGCVPSFVYILLWKAVYGNDFSKIGGYSYTQIITYYVLIFLCSRLLNMRENTVKIADMIQDGSMHNFMLKPTNFICFNFMMLSAEKVIYLFNISIPFLIFVAVIHKYIYCKFRNIVFFLVSFFLAFVLKYIIGCILGFLATWIEEISGLLDLWDNIEGFLSGGLLPLTLFPKEINKVLSCLPFKYTLFVPVDIYMGNLERDEIFAAIGIQLIWCILLSIVLIVTKVKANRMYCGYGS